MRFTKTNKIVVLTGAGVSAESGLKTFRDSDGLWENYRVEDVATSEAFNNNPELVWEFYKQRYEQLKTAKPNPAHFALKKLEDLTGDNFSLITQNIDGLHTQAGNRNVIEMHGSIGRCFCVKCNNDYSISEINLDELIPSCPECKGMLRPDVVWFGELPYHLDRINDLIKEADYFIIIGTSGMVYPAAGFLQVAKYYKAITIGINREKPANFQFIDRFYQGKAGELLPKLVDEWMEEG
ncbi:MAG: NAD-dependent deacylase [Candidatus Cloacimonadota bacterium]|nr:NAD-dependent deacylase [Candidatus Cloacimonadota bacterium]